jgi:hypothetical protein
MTSSTLFFVGVMMITIPSLSPRGWVMNPEEQLDKQLDYYASSNPSQTLLYNGNVYSLQSAIFECGGNMDTLTTIVSNHLTKIFGRIFPEGASISVSYEYIGDSSAVDLLVSASDVRDSKNYDLAGAICNVDSSFVKSQNAIRSMVL